MEARQLVINSLESTEHISAGNIFVHGYRVAVKERTLKRGTSLLKHARFLANLEVTPIQPQPLSPEGVEEEEVLSENREEQD